MKKNFFPAVLLALAFIASSAYGDILCYKRPSIQAVSSAKCPLGWTKLDGNNFGSVVLGSSCTACQVNLAGTWHYVITKSDGTWTGYDVVLAKSGTYYVGSNNTHTVMATTYNRDIKLTLAVSGEEVEGWALHAEGHLFGADSKRIVATFQDSQGHFGSLTAVKD